MSETVTIYSNRFAFLPFNASVDTNPRSKDITSQMVAFKGTGDALLVGFEPLPTGYSRKKITAVTFFAYGKSNSGVFVSVGIRELTQKWDEHEVVSPDKYGLKNSSSFFGTLLFDEILRQKEKTTDTAKYAKELIQNATENGIYIDQDTSGTIATLSIYTATAAAAYKPRIDVIFDAQNAVKISSTYPSAGSHITKNKQSEFGFTTVTGESLELPALVSCELRYRTPGASQYYTITGNPKTQAITVPANTFTSTSVEYQIAITDSFGNSSDSSWKTLSTEDSAAVATPVTPVDEMIEGNQPCSFKWTHRTTTGTAATKSELEYRTESGSYSALRTITGSLTEAVLPANTFSAGTYYWRVRTYNADDVAGTWSDEARFIVVSAPSKPIISISDLSPRPLVTWQANAQQAYEIEAGQYHETYYGTEKSWRFPDFLPDGTYNARVRVQGLYGLWSEWAETEFSVSNTGSGTVNLTVTTGKNAELYWTESSPHTYSVVYRNGIPVHKTTENIWSDTLGSGNCEYYVICYNATDYNYAKSNIVKLHVSPSAPLLLDLDTGEELELPLADTQHRTFNFSGNRDIRFLHFSGRSAPLAELTEFEEKRINVTCAYLDDETHDKLMEFSKHLLCFKSARGMRIIGYIESFRDEETQFYSSAGFTIRQADYEEMIDIDS